MIRQVIAAVLATAAWAPAVHAQEADVSERGERRMERAQGGQPAEQRHYQAPSPAAFQPRAERPDFHAQAQAQLQAQAPGGWQSRGGGSWGGRREAQQPAASAPPRADVQAQSGWQGRGDWHQRGDQPRADAQAQAQAQIQARGGWQGRDRGGYDRAGVPSAQRDGYRAESFNRAPQADWRRTDAGRTTPYVSDQGQRYEERRGYGDYQARAGYGSRYGAPGGWNRGWRNDDRYDWGDYRRSNRDAFRLPRYYAPSNWTYGYRRFSVGVTLSSLLWGQNYWIEEPDFYRLPPAYGPYRWVRYFNDALLVDIRTGLVVDSVYDIFW